MSQYILARLIWIPFLLISVAFITFILGRFGPGDPVEIMMGTKYDPVVAERIRIEMGLDKPILNQFGAYLNDVIRGDFGESLRYRGRSVSELIAPKLLVSAKLSLVALLISVTIGLPLGFMVAHKQGTWIDPLIVSISLFFMSIPIMITIPALLWFGCLKTDLVPCSGWGGIFDKRIIIPSLTMGIPGIAFMIRIMRASTLDVLGQDYIRTAKAKGLSFYTVSNRHVLRNAMIPIVTILSFSLAGILGGAFITETILGIPGVGRFSVESIFNRDYPVIMAITLISAIAFIFANLLADISYSIIDPRIRYK
ncbi:ABC transporter permease [Chloroflexi bacterium]|nr:ABC transporter permease [Chloroflexota bacterium]|tara:strand:+ start:1489 stop:2418 length:930 start_codon:yes stop_codon:yes gene_type:complete